MRKIYDRKTCNAKYRLTDGYKRSQERYRQSKKGKDTKSKWAKKHKLDHFYYMKKYRKNNQIKYFARNKISDAIHRGIIKKASDHKCANPRCENQARDYHHPNGYSKQHIFDVIPLCRACHCEIHHSAH